jgi:hypothetical protein
MIVVKNIEPKIATKIMLNSVKNRFFNGNNLTADVKLSTKKSFRIVNIQQPDRQNKNPMIPEDQKTLARIIYNHLIEYYEKVQFEVEQK